MSVSEAGKKIGDDILHALNVVSLNANVGKHEEMSENTSKGTTLGCLDTRDLFGPSFGSYVVSPE